MKTTIQGLRIVSPDREIIDGSLVLEDGRIQAVIEPGHPLPPTDLCIDGADRIAMPGFFDIHAHGADGHDLGDVSMESVRHIAKKKLREGVTTWLPTTLTQAPELLLQIAAQCAAYQAAPEFCRVPGLHVEGPFINPQNAGAQNPEFVRSPNVEELKRLHQIAPIAILSLAPEMPGALDLIHAATDMGVTCSAAHTSSTAAQIRAAKQRGLKHLTHFGNAMTPMHHREIGVVGAGLLDGDLMLELICDTIHLSIDMLELIFKLVSIDRLMLITDSMAASWMDSGEVMLGGLAVTVENGQARLKGSGVLAGSTLCFNHGLRNIVSITKMPLNQLVKATSWNQAQSLGLADFGKLEVGYHADIVLLDDDFSVWKTFVGGEEK